MLDRCVQGLDCAKARYYAYTVLSRYELRQGRPDAALVHSDGAVRESMVAFGAEHAETALALMGNAVVARQAGSPSAAAAMLDRAIAISRAQTLKLADRLEMQRTRAVLSMDLGAYDEAAAMLGDLLAQTTADVEERRLLRRVLATVHLARGMARQAFDEAEAALGGAPLGVESLLALQARARALSLLGDGTAAASAIRQVVDGLQAQGYASSAMEVLRARRFEAEIQLRRGALPQGLALLETLARAQREAQKGQETEFAQTLDLLGAALRASGRPAEGLPLHVQAAQLLQSRLPAGHPLLERNHLLQLAAQYAASPTDSGRLALSQQWQKYANSFPAGSHWRAGAARMLGSDQAPSTNAPVDWVL